jgi:uncharacterized membrane protein YgcG
MDAASSASEGIATATYLSASSTPTSDAAVIASSFSWLSIKEVFVIVVLYMWYMFLFLACGVVIIGGIYLVCMGVLVLFGVVCEHGPKLYSKSKERLEKYRKSSMDTDIEGQNAGGVTSQSGDPQTSGVENGEGSKAEAKLGSESV